MPFETLLHPVERIRAIPGAMYIFALVGRAVTATAVLQAIDGRRLVFVVDHQARFEERVGKKGK
jgi:hypothetical protein